MNRWKRVSVWLLAVLILLTGCMRTDEFDQRIAEDLPREVQEVQVAVDQYRKEHNNVLPLKPPQGPTLYQKYILDFSKMSSYLPGTPSNSFQKGGHFVFVVVDPGAKKPQVRVLDLRVTEKLRELQGRVDVYKERHGKLPKGPRQGEGIYDVDYEALKMDRVTLPSPYHSELTLSPVLDSKGTVYVDYRKDVMRLLEESDSKPAKGQDLREILYKDSLFVPAHSLPMKWENGEPVMEEE